jgi:hypothetical protein
VFTNTTDPLLAANNVGIDLRLLGEFRKARDMDRDALKQLRRRPEPRYRDLFRTTHNIARDLHGLGQYTDALRRQRDSLDNMDPVLAADHPFVLQAKMSHAGTLREAGDFRAAEGLAGEAFAAHVRRFGDRHPNTLAARVCLAMTQISRGAARQARAHLEQALRIYRVVLGDGHPFTHACEATLGIALRAQGHAAQALRSDERVFRALTNSSLGPHRYFTLCSAVGLANDRYLLGEFAAAYELSSSALKGFKERYGSDHPHTLAASHNRVVMAEAIGRRNPDGPDPRRALGRLLGDGHPRVRAALEGRLLECHIEPTPL